MIKCIDNGIKDVVWVDDSKAIKKLINKKYYRKKVVRKDIDFTSYFFFRNKELKEYFMENCFEYIEKGLITLVHDKVGTLLGYPPKAISYFMNKNDWETLNNISMNFCGMYFASYRDTLLDDVKWLLENKPIINGEIFIIGNERVLIGSDNWLEKVYEIVNTYIK